MKDQTTVLAPGDAAVGVAGAAGSLKRISIWAARSRTRRVLALWFAIRLVRDRRSVQHYVDRPLKG